MNSLRVPLLTRPRVPGQRHGVVLLVAAALLLSACAHNSFVVNAQRALTVAPSIYDSGITFAEQNKAKLSPETLLVFERIRVQFPPAYRAFDAALATYIASGKTDPAAVSAAKREVDSLVANICVLVMLNGGPDLGRDYKVK